MQDEPGCSRTKGSRHARLPLPSVEWQEFLRRLKAGGVTG